MAAIPGVRLVGLLYEGGADAEGALRCARLAGGRGGARAVQPRVCRVSTDTDIQAALEEVGPVDLGIMANFGIRLSPRTLESVGGGFINFHPGLLPEQAGRAPISRIRAAGGGPSGLTVHRATQELDNGPILRVFSYTVDPTLPLEMTLLQIFRLGLPFLSSAIDL